MGKNDLLALITSKPQLNVHILYLSLRVQINPFYVFAVPLVGFLSMLKVINVIGTAEVLSKDFATVVPIRRTVSLTLQFCDLTH